MQTTILAKSEPSEHYAESPFCLGNKVACIVCLRCSLLEAVYFAGYAEIGTGLNGHCPVGCLFSHLRSALEHTQSVRMEVRLGQCSLKIYTYFIYTSMCYAVEPLYKKHQCTYIEIGVNQKMRALHTAYKRHLI